MDIEELPLVHVQGTLQRDSNYRYLLFDVGDGKGNEKRVVAIGETARSPGQLFGLFKHIVGNYNLTALGGGELTYRPEDSEVIRITPTSMGPWSDTHPESTLAIFRRHYDDLAIERT